MTKLRIAVDRGGTFTDVIAQCERDDGSVEDITLKLLSVDPENYKDAPTEGIRRVLEQATGKTIPQNEPIDLSDVDSILMGTTVATNALLERKGDRVAFLVTKGFKDVLTIGQQSRPDIFDISVKKLGQLYEDVYEVDERVIYDCKTDTRSLPRVQGSTGEQLQILKSVDRKQVSQLLSEIWDKGIRSLAISFMHSYLYSQHEEIVEEEARKIGFEDISVSSKIQPTIKIVSRASSAVADAYLSPMTVRYIDGIGKGFKGGLEEMGHRLLFMQSDGGLVPWSQFSGLRALLSGPAGGVVGFSRTSYDKEDPHPVLGFDMGGTSTDVARFDGNLADMQIFETNTAEIPIHSPQLDINTVAAGGGSILFWKRGMFVVGPESAGAHPGPACYRKGGPLTVTDCNLFLGRIIPDYFPRIFGPNQDEPLDVDIVVEKFNALTDQINKEQREDNKKELTVEQVALGFLAVANETMCRPIRTLTEGKGYTTKKHHLASFGGAGGQHAADIAHNLGIRRVIIHQYSSILSAYGMSLADVVSEAQSPASADLKSSELASLNSTLDDLENQARENITIQGYKAEDVALERYLDIKYKGTETTIMIQGSRDASIDHFKDKFTKIHSQEFGFTLERDLTVENVRVRAVAQATNSTSDIPDMKVYAQATPVPENQIAKWGTRKVCFSSGESVDSVIGLLDEFKPGQQLKGPAVIIDRTQTIVVPPNATATSLPRHVVLDIGEKGSDLDNEGKHAPKVADPITLSLFSHRFMCIAEQMGQTLEKTAISTNIKERLDFSCAIFAPNGDLVANAPHIPVHLGSMSTAIQVQKQKWEGKLNPGDVLLANHPAHGGSHLPDLTVITPVFDDKKNVIFWIASRGHHADIGGITAGSMPPFSKYLWEEGAMIEGIKIVESSKFKEDLYIEYLSERPAKYQGCSGSRSLQDSISDLKAQISANNKGIQLIGQLIEEFSLEYVQFYMYAIQEYAENCTRQLLKEVAQRHRKEHGDTDLRATDYLDDGTMISVSVLIDENDGSAHIDFKNTGPQVHGNLNAPFAVTCSAVVYVLRCLIKDDVPLNSGILKPVTIDIPKQSVLCPSADAAVVGGNVETSQRITDVLFAAFGAVAGSQGTCNNFTFGNKNFGYYETIAGGAGAGPSWDGQSGVQIHMTNTRSTDAEIFEKRYPVILHEFSLRTGSGGIGQYTGGCGIVRDIEFRDEIQASILSERRSLAPYGLAGGHCGQRGENLLQRKCDSSEKSVTTSLGGKNTVHLSAGDRIIIKTPGGGGYGEPDEKKLQTDEQQQSRFIPRATGTVHIRASNANKQ